jgi:hypothetical protein
MEAPSPPLRRRSIVLTIACAVAFAGALQALAFSFSPIYRKLGAATGASWLPAFVFSSALVSIGFLVTLWWRMRRWALWGYLTVALVQSLVWGVLANWGPTMLLYPGMVVAAAVWCWPQLR